MDGNSAQLRAEARQSFDKARRRARRERFSELLTGKESRLLPFDLIRTELRLQNPLYRQIQDIPLDRIVGSMGRYADFNRHFLPLSDSMRDRWINVETYAAQSGWPPIELYKVGDAYFVKDGNHRTAIAQQMGLSTIEAHVWEYPGDVELVSAENLDAALISIGKSNFLAKTNLDELVPDHTIIFTSPGRYGELLAQIENLRQKLCQIDEAELTFEQAVPLWYDIVYLPTIQIIYESGLLDDFTGRTEADLFVWLSIHRAKVGDRFGEFETLSDLAQSLAEQYREAGVAKRVRQVRNLLGADELPPLIEEDEPIWSDTVYQPTLQIIREAGLMDGFTGNTEADLFSWLSATHHTTVGDHATLDSLAQALRDPRESAEPKDVE